MSFFRIFVQHMRILSIFAPTFKVADGTAPFGFIFMKLTFRMSISVMSVI